MKKITSFNLRNALFSMIILVTLLFPFSVGAERIEPAPPRAPLASTTRQYVQIPSPSPYLVDGGSYSAGFTVNPGDFHPAARIEKVTIWINFAKSGTNDCVDVTTGDDWAEEVGFSLQSPDGTLVSLVSFFDYKFSNPAVGYVEVLFDDDAPGSVIGQRISSGTFRSRSGQMNLFNGMDPTGQWILFVDDNVSLQPVCYVRSRLEITATLSDLSIEKHPSDSNGQLNGLVMAGQEMFWSIHTHNAGPYGADGVVVTDTLPAEVIYLGATAPCTHASGTVVCDLGFLAVGEEREFLIKTLAPADIVAGTNNGTLTLNNQARVDVVGEELNPEDNETWASVLVEDLADLRVTKMSKPDTQVLAGETFTYTIFVDNLGPSFARYVWIQDKILSSGYFSLDSFVSNRDADCEITGEGFDCGLLYALEPQGYIPEGPPPERWTIQVQVTANETQDINNEVNVFTIDDPNLGIVGTPDPDLSNNQAIDFISVLDVADLSLMKGNEAESIDGSWLPFGSATAGLHISYTLTVDNEGPSTAENVVLKDSLPAGVALEPGSLLINGVPGEGSCVSGTPGDPLQPLTCGLGEILPGEEPTAVQFVVRVDSSVVEGTILENDAWVTSDIFDPDNSDNYAFSQSSVQAAADLGITKVAQGDPWLAGDVHNYLLTIYNDGPSYSHEVVINDSLPDRLEFISATQESGEGFVPADCQLIYQNDLRCYLERLQPNETIQILLKVHILPGYEEEINNRAIVSSSTYDPNPDNNDDEFLKLIQEYVDLGMTLTAPQHVYAGEEMFYNITVTNRGATPVEEFEVANRLPIYDSGYGSKSLVVYLGSTGEVSLNSGDDCDFHVEENEVICELYDLDPSESKSFQIKVLVRPDLLWLVEETGWDGTFEMMNETWLYVDDDGYIEYDYAEVVTTVEDLADLSVIKMSKPDTEVRAGELFTYTILVDNLGPSSSRGVVVQDNILSSGNFTVIDVIDDRSMLSPDRSPSQTDWSSSSCSEEESDPLKPESPTASQVIECRFPEGEALEPQGWYPDSWSPPTMPRSRAPLQGELLSGQWTIQIVVQANEAQDINNVVKVFTMNEDDPENGFIRGTPDPDLSNNRAIDFITVLDASDLELTKSVLGEWQYGEIFYSNTKVSRGMVMTYTLTISNTGASTAENVVLQDNLPVEPTIRSITPSQGRCFKGVPGDLTKPMTCNLGTVSPGTAATVTVVTRVPEESELGTIIYNEAWIFSDMFDPDNGNNVDWKEMTVIERIKGLMYLPVIRMPPTVL